MRPCKPSWLEGECVTCGGLMESGSTRSPPGRHHGFRPPRCTGCMTVPGWAWAAFAAFVIALLALDLFVLHRRAHEVSLKEAGIWSAVWVAMGLGFGGILWAWRGGDTAQDYLAGYLIEKS